MSISVPNPSMDIPAPLEQGGYQYVDLPKELVETIVNTPTPFEKGDGTVSRMKRTQSFRGFYRATESLDGLSAKPHLDHHDFKRLTGAHIILSYAQQLAETDPNVTPELYMRIRLTQALATITAYTGTIAEARDEPRTLESYGTLFFADAYSDLAKVGAELMLKNYQPKTEKEAGQYAGFAQEIAFHLVHYRKKSALCFTTPASVRNDFFREEERFDATAYNLEPGRESRINAQIKRQRSKFGDISSGEVVTIYGKQDMFNTAGHPYWTDTFQAQSDFPTLTALLDEAAGDTSDSAKLDAIADQLHDKLFS